jgi:hypothetical protein
MAQAIAPNANLILLHVAALPFEGKLRYACIDESIIALPVGRHRRGQAGTPGLAAKRRPTPAESG